MGAHAVHSLPPHLRSRQKKVRKLLEAAKKKYPDGIPPAVRKAIFKDPAAVELARGVRELAVIDLIAGTAPEPFSTSKTSNWVARVGGLPTLIQHVAHDLMEKGNLDESHAIGMAVGIVHNWSHGHDGKGHRVSPQVVAEAVKAIAEWDAKRARVHSMANTDRERRAVDLAFAIPPNSKRSARARLVELVRHAIYGQPVDLAALTTAAREAAVKKGQALPGGRFPIRNEADLRKAIMAVGRARPNTDAERAKIRRFIISRAKALGLESLVPSSWSADGSLA